MLLPLSKLALLTHLDMECVPVACSTLARILSNLSLLQSLRMQVGRSSDTQKDADALRSALVSSKSASGLCDLSIRGLSVDCTSKVSQKWLNTRAQLDARFIAPCLLGKQHLTRISLSKVSAHDVPCVVEHMQCMHQLREISIEWKTDLAVKDTFNAEMLTVLLSNERVLSCCTRLILERAALTYAVARQFWQQITCMSQLQHLEVPTMQLASFQIGGHPEPWKRTRTLTHLKMDRHAEDLSSFRLPLLPTLTLKSFSASFENISERGLEAFEEGLKCLCAVESLTIESIATHYDPFDPLDALLSIIRQQQHMRKLIQLQFRFTDLRRARTASRFGSKDGLSQLRNMVRLEHLDLHECVDMDSHHESLRARSFARSCFHLINLQHLSVPFVSSWGPQKQGFKDFCSMLTTMESLRSLTVSAPQGVGQECLPGLAIPLQKLLNLRTLLLERSVFGRGRRRVTPEDEVQGMFSDPQYVEPLLAVLRVLPQFVCLRVNGGSVDVLQ